MFKIIHIIGARPNFIKAFPVVKNLSDAGFLNLVLHTGQHFDKNMSKVFFEDLEMPQPNLNLNIGHKSQCQQISEIIVGCEKYFSKEKPDLVFVYGDVTSSLAAAICANKMGIKIAHVESGLRSFDRSMPEEINRTLVDSISDILFLTCKDALNNLKKESVNSKKCYFVGNTMIDSLVSFSKKIHQSTILKDLNLTTKNYSLITLHRPSNVDNEKNLNAIIKELYSLSKSIGCIFPVHPRTKKLLENCELYNPKNNSLLFVDSLGYLDFMNLQKNSKFIITDSGGVQEESSFFNIPCLTLRDNTERPITISDGTNHLIGSDPKNIRNHINKLDYNKTSKIKYWDGLSSSRITKIIKEKYYA